MDLLKLVALDKEDLEIVSAHLQDAVVKVGEIVWQPEDHRLVVGLNRFDWEAASSDVPAWQRRRSATSSGSLSWYSSPRSMRSF